MRRGPRGGRIPGAVNLPRAALMDPENGWQLPLQQQAALLASVGVVLPGADGDKDNEQTARAQQRIVLYCNGGVAACTAALALHRLGHRQWSVYDGSWNEYSCTEDLPVEV